MNRNTLFVQNRSWINLCLLLVSIILALVGYVVPSETTKSLAINLSTEFFSVAALFFLFNKLLEEKDATHANEKITIVLRNNEKKGYELPPVRRMEFTRQEILGRIGMIPMKGSMQQRFQIKYVSDFAFLLDINRIAETGGDTMMYIQCTKEEMEQFEFPGGLS